MELAELDYVLPPELIAQTPTPSRDASRLLVIDRERGVFEDRRFAELPDLLRAGDCLVVNNSRVIPARVMTHDAGGRSVELLFIESVGRSRWRALLRPGRRGRAGVELVIGDAPAARLRIVSVEADGSRVVERLDGTLESLMATHGRPPLPPYIARDEPRESDRESYQTVYANERGAIAAPTAGLHFTRAMLDTLRRRGVEVHELTLHVGPGTFRPIKTATVEEHVLPPERVVVRSSVADGVSRARAEGRRVVAVGTTTARALESAAERGRVQPLDSTARIYITPGYTFQVVDALLTNFHLPRSSLLVLVAALAGKELILKAYAHAVHAGYRFYSYGDATLIL